MLKMNLLATGCLVLLNACSDGSAGILSAQPALPSASVRAAAPGQSADEAQLLRSQIDDQIATEGFSRKPS
jgi:hypothetical protein